MLYRQAGQTGERVSILGFGCMRLPTVGGKSGVIDEPKAQAMVDYAIANGVNYFDTAYVYHSDVPFQAGAGELFVGKALKPVRQQVHLATKLPSWFVETRADMDRYLNLQLERLQTDRIDFYLLHNLNEATWNNLSQLGVTAFLDAALADGRIKHAGFSFHDEAPLFKKIVDAYRWSFCQIQYNFMDENLQAGREGLLYAANKGLGVIVMEPLRGGTLAANLPAEVQAAWERAATKRTPAEWALRFVWDRAEPCVVLSGMTTMDHVVENVRVANDGLPNSLTDPEHALIQEVREIYEARTRVNCTSCRYCLPCPNGVDIPANLQQLNNVFIYGDTNFPRFFYHHILKEEQRASNCDDCGTCEDLCPQEIPVRDKLKEVAKELENSPDVG